MSTASPIPATCRFRQKSFYNEQARKRTHAPESRRRRNRED